jgi:hypothetical protein
MVQTQLPTARFSRESQGHAICGFSAGELPQQAIPCRHRYSEHDPSSIRAMTHPRGAAD